jgi:hypothetical protein
MQITHWVSRPVFDDPVRPPIDGTLTWTCRAVS